MIQSTIGHLQININPQNKAFYKDLFAFTGWNNIYEDDGSLGVLSTTGASLWFMGCANEASNDYDGAGLNHIGLSVPNQGDVDLMVNYLREHNIPALFETPRHRPDFASSSETTYYQVMFKSPDSILFEVVYMGPLVK